MKVFTNATSDQYIHRLSEALDSTWKGDSRRQVWLPRVFPQPPGPGPGSGLPMRYQMHTR